MLPLGLKDTTELEFMDIFQVILYGESYFCLNPTLTDTSLNFDDAFGRTKIRLDDSVNIIDLKPAHIRTF